MDLLSHSDGDNSQEETPVKKSNSAAYEMIPLEPDFEPTSLDVICARGKEAYNHPGNIRFRALVQDQLHNYQTSTSKMAKSHIVREIIESVRRASPKGGFVKKVNGKWWDVGERARREKTGQQIRDLLHTQYRSSTKAKARTRKRLRKSHSANSATKAIAHAAAASMGVTTAMTSRSGNLPARIVTLDSESNNSAAAAARSALAQYRRNSESDLAAVMAARASSERDYNLVRDSEFNLDMGRDPESSYGLGRIREVEPTFGINRFSNNMNMGAMNQSSMASQGWASMGAVVPDNDGFPPLRHAGGLSLQNPQQRQQLSDFSSLLHQPHPNAVMSQNAGFSHVGAAQPAFIPPFGGPTMTSSHFDNHGMTSSFRAQQTMAFQSALGANSQAMMQGQPHNMQAYASSNTRPQDSAFSDIYQKSSRMVRQVPNEDMDPLLLPVDSNIFKEDPNCRNNRNNHVDSDEEESEQSFEEAIDNIYSLDGSKKRP